MPPQISLFALGKKRVVMQIAASGKKQLGGAISIHSPYLCATLPIWIAPLTATFFKNNDSKNTQRANVKTCDASDSQLLRSTGSESVMAPISCLWPTPKHYLIVYAVWPSGSCHKALTVSSEQEKGNASSHNTKLTDGLYSPQQPRLEHKLKWPLKKRTCKVRHSNLWALHSVM